MSIKRVHKNQGDPLGSYTGKKLLSSWVLGALGVLVLFCILLAAIVLWRSSHNQVEEHAEELLNFLDDYLAIENREEFLRSYSFAVDEDIVNSMDNVLTGFISEKPTFVIVRAKEGFVRLRLTLHSAGQTAYPDLGVFYQCDSDDNIVKLTLGRLQPFSRYDTEYGEVWKNVG